MPLPFITLKEILERTIALGGTSTLITGKPGVGKTVLLLDIAGKIVGYELCIFRGLDSAQEFRFPGPIKVIGYDCRPKFFDSAGNQLDIDITFVSSYDALLKACELNKLNAVYFPFEDVNVERGYWISFAKFLAHHRFPAQYASMYVSLFIDEAEDIIPKPEKGKTKDVTEYLESFKKLRKSLVSSYFATQQFFDVHWQALGKINYKIYLRGAFTPKRESRVDQRAVDVLPRGQGILAGSYFGYFTFPNLPAENVIIVKQ